MKIVATTSLPAVDRPNADRWNAARANKVAWSFNCQAQGNCSANELNKYSHYYHLTNLLQQNN